MYNNVLNRMIFPDIINNTEYNIHYTKYTLYNLDKKQNTYNTKILHCLLYLAKNLSKFIVWQYWYFKISVSSFSREEKWNLYPES